MPFNPSDVNDLNDWLQTRAILITGEQQNDILRLLANYRNQKVSNDIVKTFHAPNDKVKAKQSRTENAKRAKKCLERVYKDLGVGYRTSKGAKLQDAIKEFLEDEHQDSYFLPTNKQHYKYNREPLKNYLTSLGFINEVLNEFFEIYFSSLFTS